MRITCIALSAVPLALALGRCAASSPLDRVAEAYVKLVLAVGRHDDNYVDAYYGPPAWKTEAASGDPVPVPELLKRTRALLSDVRAAAGPADRKRYLEKQLVAIEGELRRLSGETMTLTEECRVLYDADPPHHDVAEFAAAHESLEKLVPGAGTLAERIETLRKATVISPQYVQKALEVALAEARRACAPLVALPAGETFETAIVHGKPWGAYNWYLGGFKSRIELNVDLPTELNRLLGTMCHEGYPGHHVYNVLIEDRLVKGRGWIEYTVYPLYSPQSLLAEGTANAGIDIAFTDDERRRVLGDVLAPAGGLSRDAILAWDSVRGAMKPLGYVNGEAARMLLDEGRPEDDVVQFIERWGLVTEERAKKSVQFAKGYRAYVFNYTLGEDLVRAHIGKGPDRNAKFFRILEEPTVPSDLVR